MISPQPADDEREGWLSFSLEGLAKACGEDEPEYTLDMLQELNADYAAEQRQPGAVTFMEIREV